ncbi:predicted protein [Pyrenophora tritici-repentis Pt-1C-BFP]|uniref:HTH CENPB-type domain-containing protein n=1 Tax=Pyrenophora tritici-repentis (strain Pt-1C-BFP) TaxID=426418 RepID=B2W1W7_PYRTR|nr:uncharacterized protein PTRG_03415 [Pyrenophora tritici-repentis Pt-1C-BFP]EDU46253.1 predicted protein [Pyrenophora tritici-repentis Pt-1C-BFP]
MALQMIGAVQCGGQTSSERDKNFNQQKLNPQQELELVRYIEKLTKRGIPPTREMIRNFSSEVAHQQLSESWVTRFINRHEICNCVSSVGWRLWINDGIAICCRVVMFVYKSSRLRVTV